MYTKSSVGGVVRGRGGGRGVSGKEVMMGKLMLPLIS